MSIICINNVIGIVVRPGEITRGIKPGDLDYICCGRASGSKIPDCHSCAFGDGRTAGVVIKGGSKVHYAMTTDVRVVSCGGRIGIGESCTAAINTSPWCIGQVGIVINPVVVFVSAAPDTMLWSRYADVVKIVLSGKVKPGSVRKSYSIVIPVEVDCWWLTTRCHCQCTGGGMGESIPKAGVASHFNPSSA